MRVLLFAAGASVLLLVACSDGAGASTLQRANDLSPARQPASKSTSNDGSHGGSNASPTPASPTPPSDPTPATDAGTGTAPTTPPATPPAPGSCASPKCFGLGGFGGCKATDSAGAAVTMGCQDGACACVAGGQTTSTFAGDVNSGDDARQLFLTNCDCQ
jgi:hypothetical protein